jgi:large subunit ribosomal protein L35
MAKFKTHKGLRKRVKVTAKGLIKARRRGKSHLNSSFSGTRVRNLRRTQIIHPSFTREMLRALGEA